MLKASTKQPLMILPGRDENWNTLVFTRTSGEAVSIILTLDQVHELYAESSALLQSIDHDVTWEWFDTTAEANGDR